MDKTRITYTNSQIDVLRERILCLTRYLFLFIINSVLFFYLSLSSVVLCRHRASSYGVHIIMTLESNYRRTPPNIKILKKKEKKMKKNVEWPFFLIKSILCALDVCIKYVFYLNRLIWILFVLGKNKRIGFEFWIESEKKQQQEKSVLLIVVCAAVKCSVYARVLYYYILD